MAYPVKFRVLPGKRALPGINQYLLYNTTNQTRIGGGGYASHAGSGCGLNEPLDALGAIVCSME